MLRALFPRRTAVVNVVRSYSSAATKQKTIGFIGLGQMGFPMASNLHRQTGSGYKFLIHDVNEESCKRFQTLFPEAAVARSPKQIAEEAGMVFTMLPEGKHVLGVFEGKDGVLSGIKEETICVDCSTIDVKTSKLIAERVKECGGSMLDAPVSGGTAAATKGTLTFMVGSSSKKDFELVQPFLLHMGQKVFNCGENGLGLAAKICNNMMLGISMAGTCETFLLGQHLGLSPELLSQILNVSSGRTWCSEVYNPVPGVMPGVPSSKGYEGGFGVALMAKDMGLAVDAAKECDIEVGLGERVKQVYKEIAGTNGYERKDFSVVFKYLGGSGVDGTQKPQ
ncbi:3-hydroxyisobutyrate dehydrogenase [Gaertneriomyces semiglobifer]|nr:3-hydroxyisobutyrate dehydrogenase [Gaertneriomyces semiglobifer]